MSEIISSIIDNELKGKDFDVSLNELAKNSNALSKSKTQTNLILPLKMTKSTKKFSI